MAAEPRQGRMVPLTQALSALKVHTGDRIPAVNLMKDGTLSVYIRVPGNDTHYVIIPKDYWSPFYSSDFNKGAADKSGLTRSNGFRIKLGAVRGLYALSTNTYEMMLHSDGFSPSAIPPEIRPWFGGMDLRSRDFASETSLRARAWELVKRLVEYADTHVRPEISEADLTEANQFIRGHFVKKRKNGPRPTDDDFWYLLIKTLGITALSASQDTVKSALLKWVPIEKLSEAEKKGRIRAIVERVWAENDLEHIYRTTSKK